MKSELDNVKYQKLVTTLVSKARVSKSNSYSPYSQFKVGAALLGDDGEIYCGTNIENASYGLTICAERAAIFNAVSNGVKKLRAICISCDNIKLLHRTEMTPCGACRQVIAEFADKDTMIIIDGDRTYSIDDLLPNAFQLKKSRSIFYN